jgi:hypothetical protein
VVAPTRWDTQVLARAAGVAGLALGLSCLVTAITDEGGISWGERAGRALPLAPACAGLGAWVGLMPVRARGEALALAALGRSRTQIAGAAVAGGALVSLFAAASMVVASAVDAAAFFPRAANVATWVWQNGSFADRGQGLSVGADGAPVRLTREAWAVATTVLPRHGRAAAALATAIAGLALPLIAAHALLANSPERPGRGRRRQHDLSNVTAVLVCGAAISASVILFQAAAAGHVPALLGAAPPLLLLGFAVQRYRSFP